MQSSNGTLTSQFLPRQFPEIEQTAPETHRSLSNIVPDRQFIYCNPRINRTGQAAWRGLQTG